MEPKGSLPCSHLTFHNKVVSTVRSS